MSAETEAALQAVYDMVPAIECKGLCHEACGLIPMTQAEYDRIGKPVRGVRLKGMIYLADKSVSQCPLLVKKRCSVYADRPLICRLYGVAEGLECPFGCRPTRYLSREEAAVLLTEARELPAK